VEERQIGVRASYRSLRMILRNLVRLAEHWQARSSKVTHDMTITQALCFQALSQPFCDLHMATLNTGL